MNASASKHKWGNERTIKFLQIYEKHPCLWDDKAEVYRSRDMRKKAYEQIVQEMGIEDFGVLDVRAKIRSLKNAYTLELAKILKRRKSVLVTEQKSKLAWFPIADRFFSKVIHIREPSSADQDLHKSSGKAVEPKSAKKPNQETASPVTTPVTTPAAIPALAEHVSEASATPTRDERIDEFLIAKNAALSTDEFDVFGAFVANELRGIKDDYTIRGVKKKIQSALLEVYELPAEPKLPPLILSPIQSEQMKDNLSDETELNVIENCEHMAIASDGSLDNL